MTHFEIISKDPKIKDPSWQKKFLADYHNGLLLEVPYFQTYAGLLRPSEKSLAFASRRFDSLAEAEFVLVFDGRCYLFDTEIVERLKNTCFKSWNMQAFSYLGKKANTEALFKGCVSQCWECRDGRLIFLFRYATDADERMSRLKVKTGLEIEFYKPTLGCYYYGLTLLPKAQESVRKASRPATDEEEAEFQDYLKFTGEQK